jgi:hypothetical protein
MPVRIQRRRTKGWRAPEGAVYVGRGTPYGNPWAVTLDRSRGWRVHLAADTSLCSDDIVGWWESRHQAHEVAVEKYRAMLRTPGGAEQAEFFAGKLAGRDLMCWCPAGLPCHADVLLELVNPKEN